MLGIAEMNEVTVCNVYVIELEKSVMEVKRFKDKNPNYDPQKPCVYVGQTAKTPEERLHQHLAGKHSNHFVEKYGVRLRPKLYARHNPLATREEAEAKERRLAERLRSRGYGVWWN